MVEIKLDGRLSYSKNRDIALALLSRVRKMGGKWVLGITSSSLTFFDMDSMEERMARKVCTRLSEIAGKEVHAFTTGTGYHFVIITNKKERDRIYRDVLSDPFLREVLDTLYIEIALEKGTSTLRISSKPWSSKPSPKYVFSCDKDKFFVVKELVGEGGSGAGEQTS